MTRRIIGFISLMILVAAGFMATLRPTTSAANNLKSGAVFVLTNQVSNAVAVFDRAPDGTLTAAGTFSTGGSGNPVAQPGDPPTDPLASQGALILSNNKFLFAVNAGSNEISVLSVGKDELTLVDKVNSGGVRPISLTVHDDLLYVLNEGSTPNITGFTISDTGELTPLSGSTRPLTGGSTADPAEVSFTNDGALLAVTEKAANLIDVYSNGRISAWNSAAAELFGTSRAEAIGVQCHNIIQCTPDDGIAATETCTVALKAQSNHPLSNFDLRLQTKTGKLWCNLSALLVSEPASGSRHTIYIVHPREMQKRLEQALSEFVRTQAHAPSNGAPKFSSRATPDITARELEVLKHLAKGHNTRTIANQLNISAATVNNHIKHILTKLDAHTRLEAIRHAESTGVI